MCLCVVPFCKAVACILGQTTIITTDADVAETELITEPETEMAGNPTDGPTVKQTEAGTVTEAITEAITTNPVTQSNGKRLIDRVCHTMAFRLNVCRRIH